MTRQRREISAHLVIKVSKQAQDICMTQVRLNLNLAPQLVLYIGLCQLGLEQHLHRVLLTMQHVTIWP
jgi:hypothetical protein